ncbi:MAG: putative transporter [Bacteroidales bacterium]|nr:putative transporter [Bacteroidales bacterium]
MGTGVAHSVLLVALVIAAGLFLSRIKIAGISLGVTWILFAGIACGHFGMVLDPTTSHFVKEFGLILFIYSIGLQVGPGFFSSFRKGGVTYNMLATAIVLLGGVTAYAIHLITGENLFAMIGVLYGAVTNTPGLGAAQQTFSDMHEGVSNSLFAQGYAMAYPLGVVGIILCIVLIKKIFRIDLEEEQKTYKEHSLNYAAQVQGATIEVTNEGVDGKTMAELSKIAGREIVVSRLMHSNSQDVQLVEGHTRLQKGDRIYLVALPADLEAMTVILGHQIDMDEKQWEKQKGNELVSERLVVTNPKLNGRRLGDLGLRHTFDITITRVKRAGVDMVASPMLILQLGDRVTVVGEKKNVENVKSLIGDSVKRLDQPQLTSIFLGIALGVLLGSMPIFFPGMPVPVKLGMAGGPLIVSILIARFGPQLKLVTYTTGSAKLLMREIGICLFLAAVGIGAGNGFVDTVINGGYMWVLYGFLITIIPLIIVGIIARVFCKLTYFTIAGLIAGSTTDPPALAYSNSICGTDQASVAYSTVYPLTMFLRVLCGQILVLMG